MVPIENEKEVGVDLNEISNIVNDIHLPEHNKFDVPDQLFDDELGFNKFEPPSDPIESPASSSPPSVSGRRFYKIFFSIQKRLELLLFLCSDTFWPELKLL